MATATETQLFFPSRMGYIGSYGSVHMETCSKGNGNPQGPIQSIISVAIAAVSVSGTLNPEKKKPTVRCAISLTNNILKIFSLRLIHTVHFFLIATAILLITRNGLYRSQRKCSHYANSTTSSTPMQPIISKNKSHSQSEKIA